MNKAAIIFLVLFLFEKINAQIVTTIAGSTSGYRDGNVGEARFSGPCSIAIDNEGNLLVTDIINKKIRKIDLKEKTVSTLKYKNSDPNYELFMQPHAIVIDKTGNIFVADYYDRKIKKINPAGIISTFAGSVYGNKNGQGKDAQFSNLTGIALDNSSGNIYVADYLNQCIRKITPEGKVSTLAGSHMGFADGIGSSASFRLPHDVAVDKNGYVYVSDSYNHKIRKITPDGAVSTIAGQSLGFYDGPFGKFNSPSSLVIDSIGNIYVSDFRNYKVRKITPEGMVSTVAGSTEGYEDGFGKDAKFNGPSGLALDKEGNLYVADYYNNVIRKITFTVPFWHTKWFQILKYIFGIIVAVFIVIIWYNRKLKKERAKNKLQSQMYNLEIRAIKAQMDPHFIFNSLNTIQQFILSYENDKAFEYLTRFSKLVRKVLESNNSDSISLENEIEILNKYLEIEALRFIQSFNYKIELEDGIIISNINIPHLLIQPFIENAIWHGLLHKEGERNLLITFAYGDEKTIKCIVDDNGVGRSNDRLKKINAGKTSLGINFISERLSLFSKMNNTLYKIEIIDKKDPLGKPIGTKVIIQLPIIH